jgi:hypothetical protein
MRIQNSEKMEMEDQSEVTSSDEKMVTMSDELMEAFEHLDAADGVKDGKINKGKFIKHNYKSTDTLNN